MKKSFLARAGAAMVALPLIILVQAPSGAAGTGDTGSGASSADVLCAEEAGVFPSSIYTRLHADSTGSVSSFEVRLFYADKNCSEVLYSSRAVDHAIGIDVYKNKDDSIVFL